MSLAALYCVDVNKYMVDSVVWCRHINVGAQFQATLPPLNGNFHKYWLCIFLV